MTIRQLLSRVRLLLRRYLSRFLFFFSRRKKKSVEIMASLKGSHLGERIFIICNGPSLSAADLNKIATSGEISFASNKIDAIFPSTMWRPSYYCIMDETYQYSLLDTMNRVDANIHFYRDESFLTTRHVKGNCCYLHTDGSKQLLDDCKFSEDCSKVLYTVATVTYAMIQLSYYMGFKEVIIIGCDNKYSKELKRDGTVQDNHIGASYFSGSDRKEQIATASTWQMNIAYEKAREFAEQHGMSILNATRGGYLDAFERVNFDSLFSHDS